MLHRRKAHFVHPIGTRLSTTGWLGLGDRVHLNLISVRFRLSLPSASLENVMFQNFILEHVKFICPTAPTRNVQGFPGNPYNAWFNVNGLEDPFEDMEGLEASAAYAILDTRSLLDSGFNDAATKPGFTHNLANTRVIEDTHDKLMNSNETIPLVHLCPVLQSAVYFSLGRFPSGYPYPPINLKAVVSLNGHFHGSRDLKDKIDDSSDARERAASLPILICHNVKDDVVKCRLAEKSAIDMTSAEFRSLEIRSIDE